MKWTPSRQALHRSLKPGAAMALVAACAAGFLFGVPALKARAAQLRSDPLTIIFHWPPLAGARSADSGEPSTWLPSSERWDLEQMARATLSPDPFDVKSLETTRHTLKSTGWFQGAVHIARKPRGVIDIRGLWRTPAAVVRTPDADRLVSNDGRLLRLAYPEGGAGQTPIITGVFADAPPLEDGGLDFGAPWVGNEVGASLRLLAYLHRTPAWPRVSGVDASQYAGAGQLTITTRDGGAFVWGGAPGELRPGEQPDDVKLKRLLRLLDDPGWINAGRPRVELYTPYVYIDETMSGE